MPDEIFQFSNPEIKMNSVKYFASILAAILFSINICFSEGHASYPVPQKTDKLLFYLQRSHNKNTIIYELNTLADGKIDVKNPIKVSWIRFEEGGRRAELSFIQRRAFGVKCHMIDKSENNFIVQFNNFNKREIRLIKSSTGIYRAFMQINNETAELDDVYIKAENNALGLPLSFKYMDVYGVSTRSKQQISERINL
jgi:hypothetical protein